MCPLMLNALFFPIFQLIDIPFIIRQQRAKRINFARTRLPQEQVNVLYTPSELDLPKG